MCITSETCRAKSVIKKLALNNLHQAGPSKPICWLYYRPETVCCGSHVWNQSWVNTDRDKDLSFMIPNLSKLPTSVYKKN